MKKAFTLVEVMIVIVILGIIAAIMLSTLKPSDLTKEAQEVLAQKVFAQVDSAMSQIIAKESISSTTTAAEMANYFKKYMVTTRRSCTSETDCGFCNAGANKFYLKDGACIGVLGTTSQVNVITPGEDNSVRVTPGIGVIYFDANGLKEPNAEGSDRFVIPFNESGFQYDLANEAAASS